jgi:hypothetical protein
MGGLTGAVLVAGWAEVTGFAGEREEALMAAVGAAETGEAGGEVATAEEGLDGGDRFGPERAHGRAVEFFVIREEIVPCEVDDLPEG